MTDVAMRDLPAAAWWPREVIEVSGPEAVSFLQGQLSQDVESLALGDAAWSFLLEPQGKVDALLRVVRVAPDRMLLHVDRGYGEAVVARIERFKLRVKADVRLLDWRVLAVRGPGASAPTDVADGVVVAPAGHPGADGYDVLGASPPVPEGVAVVDLAFFDAVRIEAGLPTLGVDLEAGAIPAETGLVDQAVSFTKGCYTGQELVARIDSRGGRAPTRLVGLVAPSDSTILAGDDLVVGGVSAGRVTSLVGPPIRTQHIGLAIVKRSIETPVEAVAGKGDRGVAQLRDLPLLS